MALRRWALRPLKANLMPPRNLPLQQGLTFLLMWLVRLVHEHAKGGVSIALARATARMPGAHMFVVKGTRKKLWTSMMCKLSNYAFELLVKPRAATGDDHARPQP